MLDKIKEAVAGPMHVLEHEDHGVLIGERLEEEWPPSRAGPRGLRRGPPEASVVRATAAGRSRGARARPPRPARAPLFPLPGRREPFGTRSSAASRPVSPRPRRLCSLQPLLEAA